MATGCEEGKKEKAAASKTKEETKEGYGKARRKVKGLKHTRAILENQKKIEGKDQKGHGSKIRF
jgi:hypothetical protein